MEGFCRACLNKFNESTELFQYCESNRRLFVYCTGLQVKRNDTFTFQLCKECYLNLKFACKFKKQCRTSDKKINSYLTLKRDGENVEFNNYLNNIEDTLSLRLPITSSNNTPKHQKNYDDDDDNVSTCTSIQNFMSDMLQVEEMLPTEAKIIREVIQEEADILEDSLDSHWLQDDMSVDNDFGMDFNFAGFSTPHSINNDHCYTPRRVTDDKVDDSNYYTPKDTLQKSVNSKMANDEKDMPLLEIDNNDVNCEYNVNIDHDKNEGLILNQNNMPVFDESDIEFDGIICENTTTKTEINNECVKNINNEHITIILNKGVASRTIDSPLTNELEYYMKRVELRDLAMDTFQDNDKNTEIVFNQNKVDTIDPSSVKKSHQQYMCMDKNNVNRGKHMQNIESTVKCELEQYVNKVVMKKKVNTGSNQNSDYIKKCSIDRNLDIALKNDDNHEFSLDQLLISPQVSMRSGASTPTINNILFGNLTPKETGLVIPDLKADVVKKGVSTDFTKEFLRDDDPRPSMPKKESNEKGTGIGGQHLDNLRTSNAKPRKRFGKGFKKGDPKLLNQRKRGYKDIRRLKDLIDLENGNDSDTLDSEKSFTATSTTDEESNEFERENYNTTLQSDILGELHPRTEANDNIKLTHESLKSNDNATLQSGILGELHPRTEANDNIKSTHKSPKSNDDDLDISISNLLQLDLSQSVDLNISIASDFLKDDKVNDDESNIKDPEFVFKMPFSPPDNKYDFNENLCKICDKTYKDKRALRIHFAKAHKQRLPKEKRKISCPKICPKCGKAFRDSSNFNKHMDKHKDPDNFKCEYCTLDFPTRGSFKKHMRCHATEIANKEKGVLPNSEQAKENEHNKDDNNREKDSEQDKGINKQFKDLNTHNKEENEQEDQIQNIAKESKVGKTNVCPICGKEIKTTGNFNIHVRRHTKSYSIKCQLCQKGFFRKYDLELHMASHNLEKKFACQNCPKRFSTRHFLIGHMYRHLGKEKFKCDCCNRAFISNQYLQQHYRTKVCLKNREALQENRENYKVSVSYKPVKYNAEEIITKSLEENESEIEAAATSNIITETSDSLIKTLCT